MELWKKELVGPLYIDILPLKTENARVFQRVFDTKKSTKHLFVDIEVEPIKNDKISIDFRALGNKKFKEEVWSEAMEFYNESLRFATDESENMSLAFANRSACFLHMQKYDECLADIELAKTANYPHRLMPKLDEREANCLKLMKERTQIEMKTKQMLSFPPNEKFPCIANVLEVRNNEAFGKHIVAKRDILVGETILVEDAYTTSVISNSRTYCATCLKFTENFIPCPNCTDVMFCDTRCTQSNTVHEMSCGSFHNRVPGLQNIVDSILMAVAAFSDVNALMDFVERALATRDIDISTIDASAQSKYGLFLKLKALPREMDLMVSIKVYLTYRCLLDIPEIKRQFDTKKKQRFLLHLIYQHILIMITNSFGFTSKKTSISIACLAIIQSLFNHSCVPNVVIMISGNQQIGITILPVKSGEQLFVTYNNMAENTEQRQNILRNEFRFDCKCSKCEPRWREKDCVKMRSDSNFQFVIQNVGTNLFKNEIVALKIKCRKFLNAFGRLPWSEEIEFVCKTFIDCIENELISF